MSAPTFERLHYEQADGLATITLARPEKRNALDDLLLRELLTAVATADATPEVRVLLLRGDGADFCAGVDLAQLERITSGAGAIENLEDAGLLGELLILMRRIEKPIVAAVHGHAVAGGAGLATACDVVLARDDAHFGYPEVHLGFVPAMVMALLRRSVGEKRAFDLVARGARIDAAEAERLGLATRVIPAASFETDVASYVHELAARSPSALRLIKRLFYGIDGVSFEEAVHRGAEVNALARLTPDTQEGVRRFLERSREQE